MALQFTKATKRQSKLRAAFFGPSGAGKTFSALRVASGMGGKIAFIDTERGSASKYSDRFEFDVLDLPDFKIETYVDAIYAAAQAGYDVLIVDSLTHGWQELLQEIDTLARAKFGGNTWAAWSKGTPKQQNLINAILNYPGHVIATMRSETVWETGKDERGKSTYNRVGLAPKQGKGIEYEFDLLLQLSVDHTAEVLKDRTGKFQDALITKPDEEFGRELVAWLSEGAADLGRIRDAIKLKAKALFAEGAITRQQAIDYNAECEKAQDEAALHTIMHALNGLPAAQPEQAAA